MSSSSSLNSLLSSASTTNSSGINISSLLAASTGSQTPGIDVSSAVAAAVYAAQAPERQWQAQQASLAAQQSALTDIQTAATSLASDLGSLNDINGPIAARTVNSSNGTVATATAAAGAATGIHTLVVNTLASAASWYSPAVSDSSAASLGSSVLTITTSSGQNVDIVPANGSHSLDGLAAAVNGAGLGITASVVHDSSGARLALVGIATGAANDFRVSFEPSSAASWSSAVLPASQGLSASTFTLSDGASTATVSTQTGESLDDLANQINGLGLALQASVTTDSFGSRLAISGNAGQSFTISTDPALAFTRASTAGDASLTVDGIPVSSASNQVRGALNGVTLNLNSSAPGSTLSLTVAPDATQITSALTSFVSDYNSAISLVNQQFSFNASTKTQGVLSGDSSVRSLQASLMQAIGYSAGTTAAPSNLADLGISMGEDGTLSLNTAKLSALIQSNASGVQSFLQGASLNGFAHVMQSQLENFTNPSSGALSIDLKSLGSETAISQSILRTSNRATSPRSARSSPACIARPRSHYSSCPRP